MCYEVMHINGAEQISSARRPRVTGKRGNKKKKKRCLQTGSVTVCRRGSQTTARFCLTFWHGASLLAERDIPTCGFCGSSYGVRPQDAALNRPRSQDSGLSSIHAGYLNTFFLVISTQYPNCHFFIPFEYFFAALRGYPLAFFFLFFFFRVPMWTYGWRGHGGEYCIQLVNH